MRRSRSISVWLSALSLAFLLLGPLSGTQAASDDDAAVRAAVTKALETLNAEVKATEDTLKGAERLIKSASEAVAAVTKLTECKDADDDAMMCFEDVRKRVAALPDDVLKQFDSTKAALEKHSNTLKAKLEELQGMKLPNDAKDLKKSVEEAATKVQATRQKVTEGTQALTKAPAELEEKVGTALYDSVCKLADKLGEQLADLEAIVKSDKPSDLLRLAEKLPALRQVAARNHTLVAKWKALAHSTDEHKGELSRIGITNTEKRKATGERLAKISNEAEGVLQALADCISKLATHANDTTKDATALLKKLLESPREYAPQAIVAVAEGGNVAAKLKLLQIECGRLTAQLKKTSVGSFDPKRLTQLAASLDKPISLLSVAVTMLQEGLAGDFSNFVADQVSLYYFTDVPRLVRILNPAAQEIGGLQDAREVAAQERRKLVEAELDLAQAQRDLADAKHRLVELREELRQARADFSYKEGLLRRITRGLTALQHRQSAVGAGQDSALDEAVWRAEQRQAAAQADRDASQERLTAAENEEKGLPARIQNAQGVLDQAQAAVQLHTKNAVLAAQAESEAFARARDNTPFWFAPAMAASTDPAKRVLIYAFGDSKTIFLRGAPEDVERVKEIIAEFDRPAPQARLTLWTLELNGEPKHLSRALAEVENELANTRARIAASLSLLRLCINEKVHEVACEHERKFDNRPRVRRFYFYAEEVTRRLGFDQDDPSEDPHYEALYLTTMPDPAGTTTLGEALMVLCLAKPQYQRDILEDFMSRLPERLSAFGTADPVTQSTNGREERWFLNLRHALGTDLKPAPKGPTPAQLEILHALQRVAVRRILNDVRSAAPVLLRPTAEPPDPSLLEYQNVVDQWMPRLRLLYDEFGINLFVVKNVEGVTRAAEVGLRLFTVDSERTRVAAADQMLKELIIAVEDDLDRHFVRPMLERLRTLLHRSRVGVGVTQRTSVLATNRLVARVSPRASAQLALEQEQDVLQAAQQLAQLYLVAQTGGLAGTLRAFGALPQDRPPELYAVTTGNVFQVTPIFDPSGQALRFRFDFVGATQVREPSGTTNPRLPRIERHTVNTEVQLSNLELREVARFEANARLGLPRRLSGGIPILKDIPVLREVPIIGWFAKQDSQAATIQESLILAQTTMYPTIADIVELLTTRAIRPERP